MFCYPEFIAPEMDRVFGLLHKNILVDVLDRQTFSIRAAEFLSELNAIHPLREGNGRTQLSFLTLLTEHAGHSLNLSTFEPERLLEAMIASFDGDTSGLVREILG